MVEIFQAICKTDQMLLSPSRIGILVFAAAAMAGSWYTVEEYSPVSNLISELGAQNTQNNFVMISGFLVLGLGIAVDGLRWFGKPMIPFITFGLFMALAGIFAHKPMSPSSPFSEVVHQIHSGLATLAGVSITLGLAWQAAIRANSRHRGITAILAVLCFVLPLCMLAFQDFQGLIQRIMYLLIFTWIWVYYPRSNLGAEQSQ